jgi:Protein of unknown function (DUF1194)
LITNGTPCSARPAAKGSVAWRGLGCLALLVVAYLFVPGAAQGADVDLALVLAVDASGSITEERWRLQMQGYADAFRQAEVVSAISSGPRHAAAVTLVEWSGIREQVQMIGWTVISDAASARMFADALAEMPRLFSGNTSISDAIDYAVALFDGNSPSAGRRVIDISGDGANNVGRPVDFARNEALARGATINGLPIVADELAIDSYYREHVIGGPGAFLVVAHGYEAFARAVFDKLVKEIALAPSGSENGDVRP